MMDPQTFNLMNLHEGYVRNFRRLNLHQSCNQSMFTKRETDYFATVGEYLGFFSFVEDKKVNHDYGRSRPMDLAWWKWDERVSKENFEYLVLHLERENYPAKDSETIDKLFCNTDKEYMPMFVIGIQLLDSQTRIKALQKEVLKRNEKQKSEVLMHYRYFDGTNNFTRFESYYVSKDCKTIEVRKGILGIDDTGYYTMCFEEEYRGQIDN